MKSLNGVAAVCVARLLTIAWLATYAIVAPASAATRLVPAQYATIQQAINASTSGDLILVSPGTYNESITFGGRNLTVRSTDGPEATIISAAGLNKRVVYFGNGESNAATLDGFTLRDGNPTTGTLTGHGGAVLCCSGSRPTILNCVIRDNFAELGGGIYICLNSSQTRLGNTTFCNNLCYSGYGFDIAQGFVDLGGVTTCAECGCGPGDIVDWPLATGGSGHFYQARLAAGWIGWDQAQQDAESRGASLVTIESLEEQVFVAGLVRPFSIAYWIGLLQAPKAAEPLGGWTWVDGSPVSFSNWGDGQPNNGNGNQHFGALRLGGTWDDFRIDGETYSGRLGIRGWIIEWSADCDGDGIVDYGQILDGTFEDANANGVPDCCDEGVSCDPCPGDVNFDGQVNGADISVLLGFWGLNGKPVAADINRDGVVNGADLAQLLGSWGECP